MNTTMCTLFKMFKLFKLFKMFTMFKLFKLIKITDDWIHVMCIDILFVTHVGTPDNNEQTYMQ